MKSNDVDGAAPPRLVITRLRALHRVLRRGFRSALGMPADMDTLDRRVLEATVLPHYLDRPDVTNLLFVGVRWYTQHYGRPWSASSGKRFITLDIDPAAARFGSVQGHLVAAAADAPDHLAAGSIDVVILNGVYGWGLDDETALERTLQGFAGLLRADGELVFGWNDVAGHRPFDWRRLAAWAQFEPVRFGPLGTSSLRLPTDNVHCFEFYRKRR